MQDTILTIGTAAYRMGKHPNTLRKWDNSGKFKPEYRTEAGYRGYTNRQIDEYLRECRKRAGAK